VRQKVKLEDGFGKVTRQNPLEGTVIITHEDGREIEMTKDEVESILSAIENQE